MSIDWSKYPGNGEMVDDWHVIEIRDKDGNAPGCVEARNEGVAVVLNDDHLEKMNPAEARALAAALLACADLAEGKA